MKDLFLAAVVFEGVVKRYDRSLLRSDLDPPQRHQKENDRRYHVNSGHGHLPPPRLVHADPKMLKAGNLRNQI
jgi:hypothetical protein